MNLNHINIVGPYDLLESVRDFYCSVMGFEVGFRPEFNMTQLFFRDPTGNGLEVNFPNEA